MPYFRSLEARWEEFPDVELKCLVKPSTLGNWIDIISFDFGDSGLNYIFYQSTENLVSAPLNTINFEMRLVDDMNQELIKLTTIPLGSGAVNLMKMSPNMYIKRDSKLQFRFKNEVPSAGKLWILMLLTSASTDLQLRVV